MMKDTGRKWLKFSVLWPGVGQWVCTQYSNQGTKQQARWHLVELSTGPPPLTHPTYIKLLQFALLICINLTLLYAQYLIHTNCMCSRLINDRPVTLLHEVRLTAVMSMHQKNFQLWPKDIFYITRNCKYISLKPQSYLLLLTQVSSNIKMQILFTHWLTLR
jgi:hypothetical protein